MANLGFYFDADRCVGCRTCQIACKDKNDLEESVIFRLVRTYETGAFPAPGYYHLSTTCNHCAAPACIASCPVSAITKEENGVVVIDAETCIGNKLCIDACPYRVPQWVNSASVAAKCDFCSDLLAIGEGPACVDACPQRALEWGDIEDLKARYPQAVSDLPVLPDSDITGPSSIVTPREPAMLATDFREKHI
ncbi:MAG: 4Fe-4S dicluster domain-containing protein [Coriobacteriales bacterium]|jgi:anaerobic dimethyl sulfoxide reductase subunit B (iron-sulfur subunit)|nr:4Fe-4S dicluster domain-containing protein [Coriobacteriales bacterium]